jgi:hypothetical protein
MLDDGGYPLNPRDFALGLYKGGGKPEDLHTRVVRGLNGTPMTGYWNDAMTSEERWAVVGFVLSIGKRRAIEYPGHGIIALVGGTILGARTTRSGRAFRPRRSHACRCRTDGRLTSRPCRRAS